MNHRALSTTIVVACRSRTCHGAPLATTPQQKYAAECQYHCIAMNEP